MTTFNSAAAFTEEGAKKRAYTLRERAEELGYKLSLGHTYDLMASAHGYRDWATMRATAVSTSEDVSARGGEAVPRKRREPSIMIGTVGGNTGAVLDGQTVRIPFSELASHMEVVSLDRKARADFLVRLSQSSIGDDVASFVFVHGGRRYTDHLKKVAKRAEAQLFVIDLTADRRKRGQDLNVLGQLNQSDLALYFLGHVVGRFACSHRPEEEALWMARVEKLTAAIAAIVVWLRENGITPDLPTVMELFSLDVINDVRMGFRHPDIPADVVALINAYCESLPLFDFKRRRDQPRAASEQHWPVEWALIETMGASGGVFQGACWPDRMDLREAVEAGYQILVSLPDMDEMTAGTWALAQALVSAAQRFAAGRTSQQFPYLIALDSAENYALIDFQSLLSSSSEVNCGFVLASERVLRLSALKNSPSVHIDKGRGAFYPAQMVTAMEVMDFHFLSIQEEV